MERVRRIGRMSRAAHNWMVDARVRSAGIVTPTIYAAIDTAPGGLPGASYLITECFPLPMTAGSKFILPVLIEESGNDQRRLIQRLVKLALKLHANGIEHDYFVSSKYLSKSQTQGNVNIDYSEHFEGCDPNTMYINAENVTVRSTPDAQVQNNVVGYLMGGDRVEILETGYGENGMWYKILYTADGYTGEAYANAQYLSLTPPL